MPVDGEVAIERLRVRTVDVAVAATRLRAESAVSRLDLYPPTLGRHAVLVVRRLVWAGSDPAPVRRRMIELARGAHRPITGPAPPGTEAVLFGDEAELLACLTADLVEGRARERWWWAHLPATDSLAAAWHARVRALPAALTALARPVVRHAAAQLTPEEVRSVLSTLCATHGLAAVVGQPSLTVMTPAGGAQWEAPWRPWLPDDRAIPLAPSAEVLVGVARGLIAHPHVARSPAFADGARRWLEYAASPRRPRALTATTTSALAAEAVTDLPPGLAAQPRAATGVMPRPAAPPLTAQPMADPDGALGRRLPASQVDADSDLAPSADGRESTRAIALAATDVASSGRQPDRPAASGWPVPAHPAGLDTALGGALYLINVASRLDLFQWDSPPLGGWAIVEGLARGLLGDADEHLASDPLWGALAELDGREPDEPLAVHRIPTDGVAAESWLARAGELAAAHLEPAELPAGWLEVRGRLEVGRTHVELVAPLSAIDVAVRRAGLDRDPGWVPELGRIVLFHFEDHG